MKPMKKHSDAAMDKATGKAAAKTAVHKHEAAMHKGEPKTKLAAGGMLARGGGAAKRGLRFTKNG